MYKKGIIILLYYCYRILCSSILLVDLPPLTLFELAKNLVLLGVNSFYILYNSFEFNESIIKIINFMKSMNSSVNFKLINADEIAFAHNLSMIVSTTANVFKNLNISNQTLCFILNRDLTKVSILNGNNLKILNIKEDSPGGHLIIYSEDHFIISGIICQIFLKQICSKNQEFQFIENPKKYDYDRKNLKFLP